MKRDTEPAIEKPARKLGTKYGGYRVRSQIEEKYGRECPDWLDSVDDCRRTCYEYAREITNELYLVEPEIEPLDHPQPQSHHDSTVFEDELYAMTDVALDVLPPLLDGDATVTEFPYASNYRTDIVVLDVDREKLRRRLDLCGDDTPLTEEWKYVKGHRWLCRNGPLKPADFHTQGPYVESTNKQVLNFLRDRCLVAETTTGYLTGIPVPDMVTAHAVELKQRDWQTAVHQAARASNPARFTDHYASNRRPEKYGYADYRWVVMDAGYADDALAHDHFFRQLGVGLISMDHGGAVKLLDAEECSPPRESVDRRHVVERALAEIDAQDIATTLDRTADQSEGQQVGLTVYGGSD